MVLYTYAKELLPPSCVQHVLSCKFISENEPMDNLIVVKSTILEIYAIVHLMRPVKLAKGEEEKQGEGKQELTPQLKLFGSYQLSGEVDSISSVRLVGQKKDCLILAFSEAKISILEFDSSVNDLVTVSLHCYEEEMFKMGPSHLTMPPLLRTEPTNKCTVAKVLGDCLAVIPFLDTTSLLDESENTSITRVLPSYFLPMSEISPKIKNVRDIVFLHGYFEPTLAILFETTPTWPGRVMLQKDTCSIMAISLDLRKQTHPIIWNVDNLPSSSFKLIPVPKPIGGVFVVGTNSLIHIERTTSYFGISTNAYSEIESNFSLQPLEGLSITLDAACPAFLSPDKMLLSLKNGDLYMVYLISDTRPVSKLLVEKVGASVLPSSIAVLSSELFFLGSTVGDSLLVEYHEKRAEAGQNELLPAKRQKMDLDSELYDVGDIQAESFNSSRFLSYSFAIRDSLLNVGPIGDFAVGHASYLSEEFSESPVRQLEVVACSGYSKNGALCVLQRNIKPHVISSFDNLVSCYDMWSVTVRHPSEPFDSTGYHKFLVISRGSSTMILELGRELQELEKSQFYTTGPTIYAGSLLNQERIIQVYASGIRLLDADCNMVQEVPLDKALLITACSVAGDFVLLQLSNDTVSLLKIDEKQQTLSFESQPSIVNATPITASCLYEDTSGLFISLAKASQANPSQAASKPDKIDQDMIDRELYGDVPTEIPAESIPVVDEVITVNLFAVVCRQNGYFDIFTLPDFELVFSCPNFPLALPLLKDTLASGDGTSHESPEVREILLVGLGKEAKKEPYLLARFDDGTMVIYKSFRSLIRPTAANNGPTLDRRPSQSLAQTSTNPQQLAQLENRLAIKFSKESISLAKVFEKPKVAEEKKGQEQPNGTSDGPDHANSNGGALQKTMSEGKPSKGKGKNQESRMSFRRRKFRSFENISGYSGLFVSGERPGFIIHSQKGLFPHPMGVDGPVYCFTTFHNINCTHGFVHFNNKGSLRICALPVTKKLPFIYDFPWVAMKFPFGRTLHNIAYHLDSSTYVVSTSTPVKFEKPADVHDENDPDFRPMEPPPTHRKEGKTYPKPESLAFKLELVSPMTWGEIDSFALRDYEHVLCIKTLNLTSAQTASGKKQFVCAGTGFQRGEELQSRGRLFIFDVIEVVPEPGKPETNRKLKFLAEKEYKSPITAIAESNGYIVACIGQKIIIHSFDKSESLQGVAFIDQQIYVTSVCAIKNTILIGDMLKSLWFLRMTDHPVSLEVVGKDYHQLQVFATEFLIDNNTLHFVATDAKKNIQIFTYAPQEPESFTGQKLLLEGDFHLGHHVNRFIRMKRRTHPGKEGKPQHLAWYAGSTGSIGFVVPVSEQVYRRLLSLQNKMNSFLSHHAGLNPRGFRLYRPEFKQNRPSKKNFLDGDFLARFRLLGLNDQRHLAQQIGSTTEVILDDLFDFEFGADLL